MLTLYSSPTCPFCRRVMAVVDRMQLHVEVKDISDEAVALELESKGGKRQVPYLIDDATETEMYESDAIVAYLQATYGKSVASAPRPRIHIADNVCISCEG